jgi:hypothetical protein
MAMCGKCGHEEKCHVDPREGYESCCDQVINPLSGAECGCSGFEAANDELTERARAFCHHGKSALAYDDFTTTVMASFAAQEREAAVREFLGKAVDMTLLTEERFPSALAMAFREMFQKEL